MRKVLALFVLPIVLLMTACNGETPAPSDVGPVASEELDQAEQSSGNDSIPEGYIRTPSGIMPETPIVTAPSQPSVDHCSLEAADKLPMADVDFTGYVTPESSLNFSDWRVEALESGMVVFLPADTFEFLRMTVTGVNYGSTQNFRLSDVSADDLKGNVGSIANLERDFYSDEVQIYLTTDECPPFGSDMR